MENIQWMADAQILLELGAKIKEWRLKQNISQKELAEKTSLSLFTIAAAEKGNRITLANFLKIIRVLNKLQLLEPFIKEEEISPVEYDQFLSSRKTKLRATKKAIRDDKDNKSKPLW